MPANAGRKPKPAKLKLLEGRGNGTDSGGRPVKQGPGFRRLPPRKPDDMSDVASALWDEIVEELQRLQITKPIDGPALEMLCEAYARWHSARAQRHELGLHHVTPQGVVTGPWVGIEERASKEYRAWCSEFGLTPAAETKVGGAGEDSDDDNPFASG